MPEPPAPLTPSHFDLRGMPYMPLELTRLFESDFYVLASGDEFKAALTLWGKSFYQIPAGSLPDDDRLLAHLSGAKNWAEVKDMALHGWIKCADGRLYHATVAEKVAEAWQARVARRARTEAARAARQKPLDTPQRKATAPQMQETVTEIVMGHATKNVTESVAECVTKNVTGTKGTDSNPTDGKQRDQNKIESPVAWREAEPCAEQRGVDEEARFEQFWLIYPRKIGKGQARRAWKTALQKTDAATMLAALQGQTFDLRERFQPHPATWLNGERWLDEQAKGDPVLRAAGVTTEDEPQPDPAWSLLQ